MATYGPQGPTPDHRGDAPISIRTCSRVGRQANPPRARLGNLLRRR
jgi:hypothetical protein